MGVALGTFCGALCGPIRGLFRASFLAGQGLGHSTVRVWHTKDIAGVRKSLAYSSITDRDSQELPSTLFVYIDNTAFLVFALIPREAVIVPTMALAKYDQFIFFGDSITQLSYAQEDGFGFLAAITSGIAVF